jgi:hypothetical protein
MAPTVLVSIEEELAPIMVALQNGFDPIAFWEYQEHYSSHARLCPAWP